MNRLVLPLSLGSISIGVILLSLNYYANLNNTNPSYQTLIGNYLFAGIIIQGIILFLFQNHIDSKRRSEDKRERHADILLKEIYSLLLTVQVLQDNDTKQSWLGFFLTKVIDGKPVFFSSTSVEELQKGVKYGWAMKHVEDKKYNKAYQLWNEVKTKIELYNTSIQPFNQNLENAIKQEMKKSFPSFEASEEISDVSNRYFLSKIKNILYSALSDERYEFERFTVDRDSSKTRCITPVGSRIDPILRCPEQNENELNLDRLNEVLTNIRNNQDLVRQHPIKIRFKMDETLESFKSELKLIVEKLEAFQPLSGKCEGCP